MRNRSRIELDRICSEARKGREQYRAQLRAERDEYRAKVYGERARIRAEWRRGR